MLDLDSRGLHPYSGIRLAFAPGPGKALLVAILGDGRLEVWRTKLDSHTFEQAWGTRARGLGKKGT